MVPHSLNATDADGGSQVLWEVGERASRHGWRLYEDGKQPC